MFLLILHLRKLDAVGKRKISCSYAKYYFLEKNIVPLLRNNLLKIMDS